MFTLLLTYLLVVAGIYFVFLTVLCFLAVAMSIVIINLHTNSNTASPRSVPLLVNSAHSSRPNCTVRVISQTKRCFVPSISPVVFATRRYYKARYMLPSFREFFRSFVCFMSNLLTWHVSLWDFQ